MLPQAVSALALNGLVADLVGARPECTSCLVGPVIRCVPDAAGCNWKMSVIKGANCLECLEALKPSLDALRLQYRLGSDDDEGRSFLTTWAEQR